MFKGLHWSELMNHFWKRFFSADVNLISTIETLIRIKIIIISAMTRYQSILNRIKGRFFCFIYRWGEEDAWNWWIHIRPKGIWLSLIRHNLLDVEEIIIASRNGLHIFLCCLFYFYYMKSSHPLFEFLADIISRFFASVVFSCTHDLQNPENWV